MLVTLVGCAVLMRSLGPDFLRNPWNPYITVLPFGLLVFLTWAMTSGQAWALPIGAGVASFCVQTHIGYASIALPLVVGGAISLTVLTVRRHGDSVDARKRAIPGPDSGGRDCRRCADRDVAAGSHPANCRHARQPE